MRGSFENLRMKDEVMKLYSYEGWGDELWIMSYGYGYGYYNRVHRDELEWLCFWAHEGTSESVLASAQVFQFMYVEKNLFYYKEILHYAALRSEWHGSVFYLRLGIWIIFETQRFFYSHYVFKGAKLAKFIRFEAGWKLMWDEVRDASISITKFTEMGWNDCVFERTEEHRRCCGKCTSFSVYACRKEHILL